MACGARTIELFGELESIFAAKVDVDQRDIWMEILVKPKRLSAIACLTDNAYAGPLEHRACGIAEFRAVVNDQAAHVGSRGKHTSELRRCSPSLHSR